MERKKNGRNFRKTVAFTLVMAMLMSTISFGAGLLGNGGEEKAYAVEELTSVNVSVRIEAATGTALSYTELNVEKFDITPFMSGEIEGYASPTGIVSAHALIESVYYSVYGTDPSETDLAVSADSTTATAIKGKLNINNDYGQLGIGSIFGDTSLVMSTINDIGGMGVGSDAISGGDNIVFYPYTVNYGYFEAGNPGITGSGFYHATLPLVLHQSSYSDPKTVVEGATVTAIDSTTYPEYPPTVVKVITNVNGEATLDLWAGTYLISAEKLSGAAMVITKPYAKVIVGNDGSTTIISPKTPDVNLEKLEIQLPTSSVNVKNQLDAGNPYINTTELFTGVTISAIAISDTATMSISQGGVTTNLTSGTAVYLTDSTSALSNTFRLKVTNGEFSKNYTFYINKVADAVTDSALITEADDIIEATSNKGITYYGEYYPEYVTALYANGGVLSDSGKEEFLADVLDDIRSDNMYVSIGRLGKIAAALTAMGIDPRQVPDNSTTSANGTTIDLIEKISESNLTQSGPYNAPYMLIGFDSGNYTVASGIGRAALINYMLTQQNSNGGFASSLPDTDTTALYIMAFAPYYNASGAVNGVSAETVNQIKLSVEKALVYLQSQQNTYGRFTGFGGYTNSNSTSLVVSALAAINKDAHAAPYIKNGYSAVQGLLSYKTDQKLVGVTNSVDSNNVSDVQGMMALVGYKKYIENRDGNIYKFSNEPKIYDNWPSEILKQINIERATMTYKAGDSLLENQITVSGIFSSSGGIRNVTLFPWNGTEGYNITGNTNLKAGGNSITVTYLGKTITFVLTVMNSDGSVAPVAGVNISVKDGNDQIIADQKNAPIEAGKTTVIDSLRSLLDNKNIPYRISGGTYVSSINGISEFDQGAFSGWLYKINGITLPTTAAGDKILSGGENIVWYYTLDFTKDSSSSAWVNENASAGGTENTISISTDVTARMDSQGNASADISASELSVSIKEAVDGLADNNEGKQTEIKINVNMDDNAVSLDTTISKASFGNLITNKIGTLTIASALGEISLDLSTLKTIFSEATGDITISITKAEKIDGRPAVDLSVMSNGNKISEFGGIATARISYTLAAGEKASGITVYYVNEEGKLLDVKSSSYEESNRMATFQTDHFSKFLIAYNQITFNDIQGHWAQAYIELLANRDIINGMTESTFVPDGNITRAQFAKLLAGLEGVDISKAETSQFSDVSQNAWYSGAVAWASANNITLGYANVDGTKNFNPNQNITRQDMSVMMKRYLDNVAKKTLSAVDAKIAFVDDKIIAEYSKEAVLQLQQAGIINGKITQTGGTEFDPTGKLTRAEAAKIVASQL